MGSSIYAMGDIMKKCIAVLLYLFLITVFLEFDIRKLIDFKQLFLVVTGACILYLPSFEVKGQKSLDKNLIGQNALWSSIIQTFILLFIMSFNSSGIEQRFINMALSCRPLLYGFCIWVILHNEEKEETESGQLQLDRITQEELKHIEILGDKTEEEIHQEDKQSKNIIHLQEIQTTDKYNDNRKNTTNILPGIEECRQQLLQAGLTRRETEVAILVIKHMSNAEIASELYISETTVKKHVSNIFSKLNISKREQIRDLIH